MKKISIDEAIKIQASVNTDDSTLKGQIEHQPFINRSIETVSKLKEYFIGKVAEIGCDFGHASLEIQKLGHEVIALDLVDFRVEETKKRGVNAIIGSMENLPFKDKEFDTGLYSHVLEHSYDFEKAVSEAKRVFKRLIIIVPIDCPYNIDCHTSRIENKDIIRNAFPGNVVFEAGWNRLNWKDEKGKDTMEFVYIVDLEDLGDLSGGWSSPNGKKEIKEWIEKQNDIKTIVDVGPGQGTYAKLLGDKYNWIGIEAWKPYIEKYNLKDLYKEIIISDIKELNEFPKADCIIFGDVLEHLYKFQAIKIIGKAEAIYKHVIISIPLGSLEQGSLENNSFETHLSNWSESDLDEILGNKYKKHIMQSEGSFRIGVFIK